MSVAPLNAWRTITFDPANGVTRYTGNGIIDGTRGYLEHLAIWVPPGGASTGPYRMYVDNVINVNADGLGDFLITNFEGYPLNTEVLFQEPSYSGSTSDYLSYPPSASVTSDNFAGGGTQSELITWFWRTGGSLVWIRDTTSGALNCSRPIIDITRPIKMDVLLTVACVAKGDMDSDCNIDLADYDAFEACLGPNGPLPPAGLTCVCADYDNDGRVDLSDFVEFQVDYTDGVPIPGCP
ncbi:MAG: hypothetical protein V2A79_00090 [Planctomycetota bacterium]